MAVAGAPLANPKTGPLPLSATTRTRPLRVVGVICGALFTVVWPGNGELWNPAITSNGDAAAPVMSYATTLAVGGSGDETCAVTMRSLAALEFAVCQIWFSSPARFLSV